MSTVTEGMITSPSISDASLADASAMENFKSDVHKLADLFSKLNPSAKEFVPSTKKLNANAPHFFGSMNNYDYFYHDMNFSFDVFGNYESYQRGRNGNNPRRRKTNDRLRNAEKESVKRTVYVSDIDHYITEDHIADIFAICGPVKDCRLCGDPHSILRFAFVEFADEVSAHNALVLNGTMVGYYPIKVLPSKTAILPVNPRFLPRSKYEREMVDRTVYCTNIDKKVTESDVKTFFEQNCGEISRLRLLGDNVHSTRIAFVEFSVSQDAKVALGCSGMQLGDTAVRVSPSKTPVRSRYPRQTSG